MRKSVFPCLTGRDRPGTSSTLANRREPNRLGVFGLSSLGRRSRSGRARPKVARLGVILLFFNLPVLANPGPRSPDTRPPMLRDVGIVQQLGQKLPLDAIFQDERARPVRLGQYFGSRPVILVLAYYNCPMLCTQVFNGLTSALRVLSFDAGKDFEVIAVSFDPRDRPSDAAAKKKAYVDEYGRPGAAEGWHFLTGNSASIGRVTGAVGFRYRYDDSIGQFAHASAIYVVTPEGKLSRYFYGIEYPPRDLRLGLVEASDGRIGSPVDQILLYCYHYDPKAGRYSAAILRIVRLGGVAAVLILGSFLAVMWRRDRRLGAARNTTHAHSAASDPSSSAGGRAI